MANPKSKSVKDLLAEADYLDEELPIVQVEATATQSTEGTEENEETTVVAESEESATATPATPVPVKKTVTTSKTASTSTATKRQLSLTDMFSSGASSSKRLKTSTATAGASGSSTATPTKTKNGLRSFNAIPFNMETYKASLSDEEKELLNLECETMGRTWVSHPLNDRYVTWTPFSFVLTVLAEGPWRRNSQTLFPRTQAFPLERRRSRHRRCLLRISEDIPSS